MEGQLFRRTWPKGIIIVPDIVLKASEYWEIWIWWDQVGY